MDEIFPVVGLVPLAEEEATAMNEQEFRSLYDATARPILAYLVGVTGRKDVADDLLQETYCRFLVRQPPSMRVDEVRRYLFRIATNLLRDRWRRGDDDPRQHLPQPGSSALFDPQMDFPSPIR